MRKLILLLGAAAALAGCAVGPDYRAPDLSLPQQWPEEALARPAATADDRRDWWSRFEDPVLDRLVARALDGNLDLRLQLQRIQEARARLGLATAERWPTLDAQAEAVRQRQPAAASPAGVGGTFTTFSVVGLLGYELDLWGRLARGREAATALVEAAEFGHDAVRLNLVTDLVGTYVNLLSARQQLAITERTLHSRQESFRLQQIRYDGGIIDRLALQQAESEWQGALARLPRQREQVRLLESALAVLVGMSPGELLGEPPFGDEGMDALRRPAPETPPFLPSELLRRRPDLRAAEAGLMAADAQIGVAMAARLPRINLALFFGGAAGEIDQLFGGSAETWGLGASVLTPVVDFGRNRARVQTAEALREQAETRYRSTVQGAFREVRDAILLTATAAERETAVQRQVASLRETLRLAELRYGEGYSGFFEVLDAQRQLFDAELTLSEAVRDRHNAAAALFKAMGGGW